MGGVSASMHIHSLAKYYGISVIIHTDHAAKKRIPRVSSLSDHVELFLKKTNNPFLVVTCLI